MGFLLQLRLLLWKNFTLKKRSPLVLMFELFIPLVLFVILLLIRKKQPPVFMEQPFHRAPQPLPSAGVMAILEQFCDGAVYNNTQGFPNFPHATSYAFLEELNSIAQHNNFFDPGFAPEDMDHIPELYSSIIDDPASLHDKFKEAKDFQIDTMFVDKDAVRDLLVHNLSIPAQDVQVLFTAKVNMTELYRVLFGTYSMDNTDIERRSSRLRRSVPDYSQDDTGFLNNVLSNSLKKLVNNDGVLRQLSNNSMSKQYIAGALSNLTPDQIIDLLNGTSTNKETSNSQATHILDLLNRTVYGSRSDHMGPGGEVNSQKADNSDLLDILHLLHTHVSDVQQQSEHTQNDQVLDPDQVFDRIHRVTFPVDGMPKPLRTPHLMDPFEKKLDDEIPGLQVPIPDVEEGLLFKILEDDPELLLNPNVLDVVEILLGLKPATGDVDPNKVAFVLKKLLLSPTSLHTITCDTDDLSHILEPQGPDGREKLLHSRWHLCNMTMVQWDELSDILMNYTSTAKIVQKLDLQHLNASIASHRVEEFTRNLQEFMAFEHNLIELGRFASNLPQNSCLSPNDGNQTADNSTLYSEVTISPDLNNPGSKNQASDKDKNDPKGKHHKKPNKYSGLLKIWIAMQSTICGKPSISKEKVENFMDSQDLNDLGLTSKQKYDLGILVHVLYSNPRVLYSPNNTDADLVIKKANETFVLMDRISEYARKWQNVSEEIRNYFMLNSTVKNLESIREMQLELRQIPALSRLLALKNPVIEQFLTNTTVPSREFFLSQLDEVDNAACSWLSLTKGISLNVFKGFKTERELEEYIEKKAYHENVTVFASVVFTNMKEGGQLPPHIIYKIRQNATFTPDTRRVRPPYWFPGPYGFPHNYYQFGFVWIQDIIERAIIDTQAGRDVLEPGSYIRQFPYPCYMQDTFLFMIEHVMPLCLTISWVYTVAMLVQSIVYEKEQRLKEVMKMMGLSNSVHWLAWFLTTFTQMSISMAILTMMLHYGQVLYHSNPLVIFLVLETFAIATIAFSFLVSVLYSKAKLAAACAGIVYFLSYVPYMYVAIREEAAGDKIPSWAKTIASLFSTTAFGLGAKYFAFYENEGVGVQWNNINITPVEDDQYNLFMVIIMMIFDTLLYGLLTWYIENVHPGSYGLPKPWYFPFTRSYWFGYTKTESETSSWRHCFRRNHGNISVTEEDQACAMEHAEEFRQNCEPEPSHLPLGVQIDNLTKVYKSGKLAVNRLTLNLYEGQITSFLGHNGAGKTTTMSILTGLFPPTSGYATIYNHDIRGEMEEIRKSLGMCPQHNVLFDKLTVEEHLWFYARLKGTMKGSAIKEEMETMIHDMGLPGKRHNAVDCLSGGMKRKLSVAIAFVAGSRTVILDEPTAGVDPYARRAIWDLLIKYKPGRTILLSTHHMDEADILGDRIAIISNGQLKCCGSSLFLKSNFGDGYHLKLVKKAAEEDMHSTDTLSQDELEVFNASFHTRCLESNVTQFLTRYVSTAYLKKDYKRELHYILPFEEAKKGGFEKLFHNLDKNLDTIEISSYGVMDTTLEEVFLTVTEGAQKADEEEASKEVPKLLENMGHGNEETRNANADKPESDQSDRVSTSSDTCLLGDNHGNEVELGQFTSTNSRSRSRSRSRSYSDSSNASVPLLHRHSEDNDDVCLLDPAHPENQNGYSQLCNQDSQSLDSFTEMSRTLLEGRGSHVLHGHQLLWQQFMGIIFKRYFYIRRNWKGLFSQILLPALFVCVAMTVALTAPQVEDPPPMVLSPAQYFNYTRPEGNYIPYTNLASQKLPKSSWSRDAPSNALIHTFRLPSGVAATCCLKTPFNSSFDEAILKQLNYTYRNFQLLEKYFEPSCESVFVHGLPLDTFVPPPPTAAPTPMPLPGVSTANGSVPWASNTVTSSPLSPKYYRVCHCAEDHTGFVCPGGAPKPPTFQAVTSDLLQDITGDYEDDYFLYTTDKYRLRRYGAMSFGNTRTFVPPSFGEHAPTEFRKLAVRRVAKVWFNHKGHHAVPIYINTLNNAILRANLPREKGNPAAYGITLINHPVRNTNKMKTIDYITQGSDVLIAIFIIVAMSFVPASFVLFLVYERYIKAKHLQFISGINPIIYWSANYVWDMCNYVIPAFCCIIILKVFDIPAYVSATNFPAVVSLFLMYGWSITPMMYPASFWFNEPSTAYICLIVINLFVGITCIITSFLLEIFGMNDEDLAHIHEYLKNVFLLFPNYCLGRGLMDIAFNEYQNEYYFKTGNSDKMRSPFEWKLMARNLVAMAIMGFCFFIITLLCEYNFFRKAKRLFLHPHMAPLDEDDDVAQERKRVLRGSGRRDMLRLENLTKIYKTQKLGRHLAVDRMCLGVPQGECFGLLGVNGAGKTTTFKMLTGDLPPTGGNAFLNGYSIQHDMLKVQQNVGYCPQFDALYDELTGREHLYLYARLRGVPYKEQKKVVEWALRKLTLVPYADKPSGTYSGGNKRKLSTAIALIGHPPVIFLDEPTTGMDPHSRRFLWDLILNLTKGGRSILLTSHSMEECEALCTRLAIMVNGRFKCLGSTQHLKTSFGDGYTVSLRVKGPNYEREVQSVFRFMQRHFPEAKLKECHHNLVQYELRSQHLSLSQLFMRMEEMQQDLQVEDYSVCQNTLDNVFINFVKQQVEIMQVPEDSSMTEEVACPRPTPTELRTISAEEALNAPDDDVASIIDQNGTQLSFLCTESSDC